MMEKKKRESGIANKLIESRSNGIMKTTQSRRRKERQEKRSRRFLGEDAEEVERRRVQVDGNGWDAGRCPPPDEARASKQQLGP